MDELKGETCPMCREKTLTLREQETEVPYFGKVAIFSMDCSSCGFKKSDVEILVKKEPCRYTLEISSLDDLKIRVVKSSEATIKWPDLKITVEPGINAEGYVANIERMLDDILKVLEFNKEGEEDAAKRKKIRKMVDKVLDVKEGKDKMKLILEDPFGNSAIISDKAKKEKLK
ncbi:ZPR1 zinc finger domain-containing protein [Candidatus Woesearchaeota archaeon]|nr:ZPR1 zinc finger domain-containing protein [Candidatus Woesearchaeota archaeon]MBW3013956.1 ZPR1 zinc finger domain-containing protein [Candidatus Woesearchaeota archaeon]